MRSFFGFVSIVILLTLPVGALAAPPRGIADFVLGETIDTCREELQMASVIPIRYKPYLEEVQVKPIPGFKTGLVIYENCHTPGRIVRIKMKYADSSKSFYETLLKRFKQRFGSSMEWRGDPFHIVLAWKWRFTDANGDQISLILQHNAQDETEKMGNAIKLTLYNAMNEAEACYQKKHPQKDETESRIEKTNADWEILMPR